MEKGGKWKTYSQINDDIQKQLSLVWMLVFPACLKVRHRLQGQYDG
jgi:hypothetical protein